VCQSGRDFPATALPVPDPGYRAAVRFGTYSGIVMMGDATEIEVGPNLPPDLARALKRELGACDGDLVVMYRDGTIVLSRQARPTSAARVGALISQSCASGIARGRHRQFRGDGPRLQVG
jgi:hypothetical protein